MPYIVVGGPRSEAFRKGAEAASSPLVLFMDEGDMWFSARDKQGNVHSPIDFLVSLVWDVEVAYPSVIPAEPVDEIRLPAAHTDEGGNPQFAAHPFGPAHSAHPFCPHRLDLYDYITGGVLVNRQAYLDVGGHQDGDWELWKRLRDAGVRFKHVPEATYVTRSLRRKEVSDGGANGSKAAFYYQASYATTYLRCLLPARHLPGVAFDFPEIRNVGTDQIPDLKFPSNGAAAVFQFPGDRARAILMHTMQKEGIRVLMEADDNYYDKSPLNNPGWVFEMTDKRLAHSLEAHQKMVPWVDGVIVATEWLADLYGKYNKNVYLCRNSVDPIDWQKMAVPPDDGKIRIGWFASASHKDDGVLLEPAMRWLMTRDDVEVVNMGHDPKWPGTYKQIPWTNDLAVYRAMLGLLDIGLCPVIPTQWAMGRSDIKAVEYAMAGALPVVTDMTSYSPWTHGFGCWKCKTPQDWKKALEFLVTHPEDLRSMQRDAKAYVLKERTIQKSIGAWSEAVAG